MTTAGRIAAGLVAVAALAPVWYAGVVGLLFVLVGSEGPGAQGEADPCCERPADWGEAVAGIASGLALWVAAAGIMYLQWNLGMYAATGTPPSRRRIRIGAVVVAYCLALAAYVLVVG